MNNRKIIVKTISTSVIVSLFFISMVSAEKPIHFLKDTLKPSDSLIISQYTSRYFLSPSAFHLKKDEVYYRAIFIIHQVNVGISKNFELGAATIPLFLFNGTASPIWLNPKFSIPVINENFRVGINGLVGTIVGKKNRLDLLESDGPEIAALVHGVVTYQDNNLSISTGFGFGYWGKNRQKGIFTLGAQFRVRKSSFIMLETFYIPDTSLPIKGLNFIGGRKVWKNNVFLDFGLAIPTPSGSESEIDFLGIPWLNVAIPIRKKSSQ